MLSAPIVVARRQYCSIVEQLLTKVEIRLNFVFWCKVWCMVFYVMDSRHVSSRVVADGWGGFQKVHDRFMFLIVRCVPFGNHLTCLIEIISTWNLSPKLHPLLAWLYHMENCAKIPLDLSRCYHKNICTSETFHNVILSYHMTKYLGLCKNADFFTLFLGLRWFTYIYICNQSENMWIFSFYSLSRVNNKNSTAIVWLLVVSMCLVSADVCVGVWWSPRPVRHPDSCSHATVLSSIGWAEGLAGNNSLAQP